MGCRGGCRRGPGRDGGKGEVPPPRRTPKDGRRGLRLRGRVCADNPWETASLTRTSGGGEAGTAAADEATGSHYGRGGRRPLRTRPRGRPWGISLRTTPRPGGEARPAAADEAMGMAAGRGHGECRCRGLGRGRKGAVAAATEEAKRRPQGSSPPWTSPCGRPWGTTSLSRPPGGVEGGGRSFGQDHWTAEGDVTSANKAARTSVGRVIAVRRWGEGERGPPPRTRP